jgi:ribulose 1,5-bisphosphate synthetase/thiazole synthase
MKYDLVVVGGGTAGCSTAYIAGKLGLKTLLLEKNIHLGGTMTSALVVPVMKSGENQINTDFYNDLVAELHSIGGQITYQNNSGWFNPELLKIVLDTLLLKVGVDIRFNTVVQDINLDNKRIKSIVVLNKILSAYNDKLQCGDKTLLEHIETRYVIDATGNCEIGKLCGCEFLNKKDEEQPINLRFMMGGVDVKGFADWIMELDKDRNVTTSELIDGHIHLSTAYTWDTDKKWALAPLFDDAVTKGILKSHDRNYFQVFTVAGMPDTIAFNCPRIVDNINSLDIKDTSKALIEGRKSIFRLANFCKIYLKGFENSYISNIADMLGVRVSRRIKGKYIYTIDDLKSGKKFKNPVVISNYPVDVHSKDKDKSTLQVVKEYSLPLESLMSADIDNLFVAGRCLSADFMSQGALRVQASCFSMGEGIAKYIASLD